MPSSKALKKNLISQKEEKGNEQILVWDQCKEIEENSRMEKTRDLFKKTGDIKGTFHARMGT